MRKVLIYEEKFSIIYDVGFSKKECVFASFLESPVKI